MNFCIPSTRPDKLDPDTAGFVEHHVLAWARAEQLGHELDLDSGKVFNPGGDFIQFLFARDFEGEMVQADVLPESEGIDRERVIDLPES
jgi:hypothetical protein